MSQWNSTDRLHLEEIEDSVGSTRSDVNAILTDTHAIEGYIELITTDVDNAAYDIGRLYEYLTGTLSSAGNVNSSVNSQGAAINQKLQLGLGQLGGIRGDIARFNAFITNFFLPNRNTTYIDPDLNTEGFSFWDYKYGEPDYVIPGWVEFMSLTQGQQFDPGILWEGAGDEQSFQNAFGGLAGPSHDPMEFGDGSRFAFWVPWQAEAWRRQLAALGANTNDWSTFTNSSAFTSMSGVFDDPSFRSSYEPSNFAYSVTHDDGTFREGTNDVSTSGGVLAQLPSLQFEILTNAVEFANMTGLTNYSVRIQESDIMPSYAGQWLIRLGKANDSNYKFGVFEKDLSGSRFAQWSERFPDWIKMICDIVFYAYSALLYLYTASYALRVLPE